MMLQQTLIWKLSFMLAMGPARLLGEWLRVVSIKYEKSELRPLCKSITSSTIPHLALQRLRAGAWSQYCLADN